jgi:hypothetical protein
MERDLISGEAAAAAMRAVSLPDVATVEDLVPVFRLSPSAVRAHLRAGTIPGRKIGRRWLVPRPALLRWLADEGRRATRLRLVTEGEEP